MLASRAFPFINFPHILINEKKKGKNKEREAL